MRASDLAAPGIDSAPNQHINIWAPKPVGPNAALALRAFLASGIPQGKGDPRHMRKEGAANEETQSRASLLAPESFSGMR
jgi:hypothetical protein